MKFRKNKKGFTIVELVIVIAVIGVLTAVLVPTFINLTQRANEASDQSLVKNLNTIVATKEQEPGFEKPNNPSDIFAVLSGEGYDGETLIKKQKSGKVILWNKKTDRFLFEENKGSSEFASSKPEDFYDFSNTLPNLQNDTRPADKRYSHYLYSEFEGAAVVDAGLDVGKNDDVTKITYNGGENARELYFKTNGGELLINAPKDKIHHFGYADSANIISVAPTSYYEKGSLGFVNIKNGRLVVEESAEIDGIFLVADSEGNFDGIKIALVGEAKLPSLARADVELDAGQKKLVVELQALATPTSEDPEPEYVWISNDAGTVNSVVSSSEEEIVVVPNPTPAASAAKEESKQPAAPISDNSVARINATGYETLAAAISAARENQTIVMIADTTSENGYLVNKSLNLDTNGKKITVTAGANVNNRAFKITNGTFKVFGGGIIDAVGAATSDKGTAGTGCYGAFRAEVGTKLELEDLTLKNYRPYGLNVKILGAQATLNNVTINSICGGGIEVTDDDGADGTVRGYAKLTNCVMTQSNFRDWCSVPVSVSGNSTLDVYASSYTGEYGVYVFSSGGTINIYGGNFAATNNAVLITSYAANYGNDSIINVYGGTFSGPYSQGAQANVHEFINIYAGTFDHDPTSYVQEGSTIVQEGGKWVVTKNA